MRNVLRISNLFDNIEENFDMSNNIRILQHPAKFVDTKRSKMIEGGETVF